jgi:hypothetical protein
MNAAENKKEKKMSTLTKAHWDVINRAIAHLEIEGCHEMADELRQVEEESQLAAAAPLTTKPVVVQKSENVDDKPDAYCEANCTRRYHDADCRHHP